MSNYNHSNYTLGELVNIYDSKRIPLSKIERGNRKGEYPYYGANGVLDYIDDYIFDGKYILFAEDGTIFDTNNRPIVKMVQGKFWLNNHAHIFDAKDNVDLNYLYYYIQTVNILPFVTGSVQLKINQNNLKKINIALPPINIQKKIGNFLYNIDYKIELNNQINKDLEELAQTLYAKWFINFDFPNEEGKPYKSSGGEMVESELGLIPKGWNVEVVQNLLSISYGKNLPKNKFKKNGFKVYGANGVVGFYDEFMFEDCTVICGCRGTVGNVYMTTKKSFITNNSLIFSSECLPNEFVYFGLKNLIPKVISGSVQKQITVESFNGLNFLLPENKVLNDFKLITNPLFEMINSNIKENDYLSKLRDTILPYLMNGTIKIK